MATTGDPIPDAPVERWVRGEGPRLHALDWRQPGAARDVLLLHGLASSARWWDLVAPQLAASGLGPVALDQRGHGESERPPTGYGFEEVVGDAIRTIRQLDLRDTVVVGHSWGGTTAVAMAAWHPEEIAGSVSVDGPLDSMKDRWTWEETEERLKPPRVKVTREQIVGFMSSGPLADLWSSEMEPIVLSLFMDDGEGDGMLVSRFPFDAHMEVVRALYEADPREWIRELRRPVLLLPARGRGDLEWERAKAESIQKITSTWMRVEWLEDSIHDVPLQRPDLVASHVVGFVGSLDEFPLRSSPSRSVPTIREVLEAEDAE